MDVLINASTGEVTVHYEDKGKEKIDTAHMDLPPDLANGIVPDILENLSLVTKELKVSYLAATPKPRLVKLSNHTRGRGHFLDRRCSSQDYPLHKQGGAGRHHGRRRATDRRTAR